MHKYVNWDAPCIFFSASKNNLKRLVSQQNQSIKLSSNAKVNAGLEPYMSGEIAISNVFLVLTTTTTKVSQTPLLTYFGLER